MGLIKRNDLTLYDRANWWSPTDDFHLLHRMNAPRLRYFRKRVGSFHGLRVLDVGCGGGFTCEALAREGADVTGIDISEGALAQARRHAVESGLKISYVHASAAELPFAEQSFDVVVCVDVLEHIPAWRSVVAECRRVLRPGGWFLFDTINRSRFSGWLMTRVLEDLWKWIPRGTHDPRLFIKPRELVSAMECLDFTEIRHTGLAMVGIPSLQLWKGFTGGPSFLLYIGTAKARQ